MHLVRPVHDVRIDLPIPASDVREALRLGEFGLTATQLPFGAFAIGRVAHHRRVVPLAIHLDARDRRFGGKLRTVGSPAEDAAAIADQPRSAESRDRAEVAQRTRQQRVDRLADHLVARNPKIRSAPGLKSTTRCSASMTTSASEAIARMLGQHPIEVHLRASGGRCMTQPAARNPHLE